ncbi:MAG: hypothetical protein KY444_09025 [Gemmatimonadetes bacterium]|nr:hypothetical protein [Gemmatimonadota bacterium]
MYMRVTRSHFDPATYDDFVRIAPDFAAAIRRLPGCRDYHSGIDRVAGTNIGVSIFDTAEHARFSRDLLGNLIPRYHSLGVRIEPPEIFEILP